MDEKATPSKRPRGHAHRVRRTGHLGPESDGSSSGLTAEAVERLAAFAIGFGMPLLLALSNGAFDLVLRQEVGLVIWWALALAVLFGALPRLLPDRRLRVAAILVAGLLAWTALSQLWTESSERSLLELSRTSTLTAVLALAALGVNTRNWTAAAAGLCTAVLVVPALSVADRLVPGLLGAGPEADLERLAEPLGYWNAVASWSAMAVATGLSLSAHLRSGDLRAASLAAVPVAVLALYLTYSRGGIAAGLAGLAVVYALASNRRLLAANLVVAALASAFLILVARSQDAIADGPGGGAGALVVALAIAIAGGLCALASVRMRRKPPMGRLVPDRLRRPLAAGAIVTALVAVVALGPPFVSAAGEQFTSQESSNPAADPATRLTSLEGSRADVWGAALDAAATEPLLGTGPGTFDLWWARHGTGEALVDAHSLYLETLAELGMVGLVLLVLALLALSRLVLRARANVRRTESIGLIASLAAVFAVFVVHAGVDWMWESTAVAVVGLGAGGIAAASLSWAKPRRRRRLTPGRVGFAIAAIGLGAIAVPGIVAEQRQRAVFAHLAAGDLVQAEDRAEDAIQAAPWAASGYGARSAVGLFAEDPTGAVADARSAIERERTEWRWRALLAVALERAGDTAGAADAAAAAIRLGPVTDDEMSAALRAAATGGSAEEAP